MYQYKDLYVLDFSKIKYYSELHEIIKKELDFPDYYGKNWDAFWDCLTDMVGRPINIEVRGIEKLEQNYGECAATMISILKEFKHYGIFAPEIQICIVRNGQKTFLP